MAQPSVKASDFAAEDVVVLEKGEDCRSLIHLHGATLLSWVAHGTEQLFLSSRNSYDNKAAIRGGVPVVFPNFGPWTEDRPMHGFARIKRWTVTVAPTQDSNGDVVATFELQDDEESRKIWDYKFKLEYSLRLTESALVSTITLYNTGSVSFDFTFALHTYFRVSDIRTTSIHGLKGLAYYDKMKDMAEFREEEEPVVVKEACAKIYKDSPEEAVVIQSPESRRLEVTATNLPNRVVWNPWEEAAKGIPDLQDDGWQYFVCVETGRVTSPTVLAADDKLEMSQTFRILSQ